MGSEERGMGLLHRLVRFINQEAIDNELSRQGRVHDGHAGLPEEYSLKLFLNLATTWSKSPYDTVVTG